MTTLLRTVGLYRHFILGETIVRAVDGIDLDVGAGEFVSVVGPSRCGKSTLLHLLGGLDRPTSGTIELGGERVDWLRERAWAKLRRQRSRLQPGRRPLGTRQSRAAGVLAGASPAEARRRATALLEQLGIGPKAGAAPALLSGGERQRVAIGRALVNGPDLLLADEPTGALDSRATSEVLRLLGELHAGGQTIALVTHDPRVATVAGLLTLRDGRVVEETGLAGGTVALGDLLER